MQTTTIIIKQQQGCSVPLYGQCQRTIRKSFVTTRGIITTTMTIKTIKTTITNHHHHNNNNSLNLMMVWRLRLYYKLTLTVLKLV